MQRLRNYQFAGLEEIWVLVWGHPVQYFWIIWFNFQHNNSDYFNFKGNEKTHFQPTSGNSDVLWNVVSIKFFSSLFPLNIWWTPHRWIFYKTVHLIVAQVFVSYFEWGIYIHTLAPIFSSNSTISNVRPSVSLQNPISSFIIHASSFISRLLSFSVHFYGPVFVFNSLQLLKD